METTYYSCSLIATFLSSEERAEKQEEKDSKRWLITGLPTSKHNVKLGFRSVYRCKLVVSFY